MRTTAPRISSPGPQLCSMLLRGDSAACAVGSQRSHWASLAPPLLHPQLAGSQVEGSQ